jgi:hypothetical protein
MWATPQTFALTATHDTDRTNETSVIRLHGDGVLGARLDVTIFDDDAMP